MSPEGQPYRIYCHSDPRRAMDGAGWDVILEYRPEDEDCEATYPGQWWWCDMMRYRRLPGVQVFIALSTVVETATRHLTMAQDTPAITLIRILRQRVYGVHFVFDAPCVRLYDLEDPALDMSRIYAGEPVCETCYWPYSTHALSTESP